jgi:hypothetical protein
MMARPDLAVLNFGPGLIQIFYNIAPCVSQPPRATYQNGTIRV